jgi:hydroxymethylpyrimidine/phosphomethylpyrimidine kinase
VIDAVKLGFIGDVHALGRIAELLSLLDPRVPIVVDPVLSATAGGLSERAGLAAAYNEHLVPRAVLVTPNVPELAALAEGDPGALLRAGAAAVLLKGGHGDGPDAVDELFEQSGALHRFARPRREVGPVRGTGCALASAIACHLASGLDVVAAASRAGDWLHGVLARVRPRPDGLPSLLPLGGEP